MGALWWWDLEEEAVDDEIVLGFDDDELEGIDGDGVAGIGSGVAEAFDDEEAVRVEEEARFEGLRLEDDDDWPGGVASSAVRTTLNRGTFRGGITE